MSQSKSVLVIDDEVGMRDLISRAFTEAGYKTAGAPDGIVGVNAVKQGSFDLVLLDMSLPKMNGLEALNRIKEIRPHVPVIMITAYGSAKTAVEALRLGAYDYITKPFELDELHMLAERALAHQHVIDENRFLRNELKLDAQTVAPPACSETPSGIGDIPVTASLRDVEMIHIGRVLESKDWNQSAAAALLGIDRKTLRSKIREFKLSKPGDQQIRP